MSATMLLTHPQNPEFRTNITKLGQTVLDLRARALKNVPLVFGTDESTELINLISSGDLQKTISALEKTKRSENIVNLKAKVHLVTALSDLIKTIEEIAYLAISE